MLGTLLEKKLKEHEGNRILVVLDDGMAFMGRLVEYDKTTIILQDIYQGSATQINWKEVSMSESETTKEEEFLGFVDWTSINLKEVYIRADHVSRIWPWSIAKKKGKVEKMPVSEPIYTREKVERNTALGADMPETPF